MAHYPRSRVLPAQCKPVRGHECYSVVRAYLSVGVGVYVV